MISIKRQGEEVVISIETGIPVDRPVIMLSWRAGSEMFAELLKEQILEKLGSTIRRTRQIEYDRGWKAAKGKRFHQDYFRSFLAPKEES
jgi:hypothetical protein